MKNTIKRSWALVLAIIVIGSVCLLFSSRKQGMFIDEIYTYGLSNSSFAPFLRDVKGGSIEHKIITRAELLDYVSVEGDEGFDFASVYYNQVNDVHPPLYYWLFNMASTFAKGSFSKWTGLVLDSVLYLASIFLLYILVKKLGGSRFNAASSCVLYGISCIGLSTMIMIRMYVMLTMLTLALMVFIADLMHNFHRHTCVFVALTIMAGLLTQYYYVFYACFLCAAYVIWALIKKKYKDLAWFVPCALAGALSLILIFPAAMDHLFSGKLVSGENAVDNLKNISQYAGRLSTFTGYARHGLKASVYTGLFCIAGLAAVVPNVKKACRSGDVRLDWMVFIVPAFLTFILVAVISPVDEPRYIYNIMPAFVLTVSFLLYLLTAAVGEKRATSAVQAVIFLAITGAALLVARTAPPDYLYPEHAEYNAVLEKLKDDPCVYFSDEHFEPITESLIQLLKFEEFYVTSQDSLDGMLEYTGDADEVVVYIDISKFWSSGYDAETILARIAEQSDYKKAEQLFTTGLSTTYLISR